jgi:ABC-2 type transport system ATP-binding protein
MARIDLDQVFVEFPVYNVNARSLKKQFLHLATGGAVVQDAMQHITINALNDISLSIEHGDRVGLIGHNGAGKSTFLRLLSKIYEPTRGQLNIHGHVSPMLDLMQGIEPELTGYENIMIRGILLGLTRSQIKVQSQDIADLTGLGDYLAMPTRTYSSGMLLRLAFAITVSIKPDILLIDEIFGAGDSEFRKKAQERMVSLLDQSSIVIMANHTDEIIKEFCTKVLLLEAGKLKYYGPVEQGLALYHSKN